jgi:tetratricopeptide (TPR) repeat protein
MLLTLQKQINKNNKLRYFGIFIILFLFLINCSTFYKSVIDKRDQNYKEGIELYNQKKYEDARSRFSVVMDIEPDYKDTKKYWASLEKIIKNKENQSQQKANTNYNKGLTHMKHRQYEEALNCFLEVKSDNQDHESLDGKIAECRKKLVPKLKETLKQTELFFNRKQYIQAYTAYQKAIIFDPSNSEAENLKYKIENKLEEKSGKYRANGKTFFSKKQYSSAQQQFELALKNNPWDNESKDYLNKVNNKLNLDKMYNAAVTDYNNADYFKAKYSFTSVNNIEPGYRATEQYLTKINSALYSKIGSIYNNGVALYEKGDYQFAINEFNKVLLIDPDHSMAAEYRQRAQSKLNMQKSLKGDSE